MTTDLPIHQPLQKVRLGFLLLGGIVALAVTGFRYIADYQWLDALWMVFVTISTVGYSETSTSPPSVKLLSMATILLGVTASAYTFTGLVQLLLEGEIDRVLGNRRMQRKIDQLSGHTIVCGFGKIGPILCAALENNDREFVVVDNESARIDEAESAGYLVVDGDATDEELLKTLRIEHAAAIVVGLPTDAENVFITLSARNLCENLRIIAAAERESSCRKLRQAGADEIVLSQRMIADHIARLVTRPSAAKFFDILSTAGNLELEIDELLLTPESPLCGQTIAGSRIRDRYELLVVGVQSEGEQFEFNPAAGRKLSAADVVLVMGRGDQIERFQRTNHLEDPDESRLIE